MANRNWVQGLTEGLQSLNAALQYRQSRKRQEEREQRQLEREKLFDQRAAEDQAMQRERHEAWKKQQARQPQALDALRDAFTIVGLDDRGRQAAAAALLDAGGDPNRAIELLRSRVGSMVEPAAPTALDVFDANPAAVKEHEQKLERFRRERESIEGGITALRLMAQGGVLPQAAMQAAAMQAAAPQAAAGQPVADPIGEKWMKLLELFSTQPMNINQLRAMKKVGGHDAGVPVYGGSSR